MCFPQCVPGAAGWSIVVQVPSTMHHNLEQICKQNLYSTGPFIIVPYSIYFCSSPPARESKPKPPWHRTEVCTGVPRYTLPQVVNPDTSNRYPPAHPPNTRPFLDCREKKFLLSKKQSSPFVIFIILRTFKLRKFCVSYRIMKLLLLVAGDS